MAQQRFFLITTLAAIEQTREARLSSINKLIEAELKHENGEYNVITSLTMFRMGVGYEKEKESEYQEQPYIRLVILLN